MDTLQRPETGLTPEETILHEVSVKLLSTTNLREVLDLIALHTAKLLRAGKTSINLAEDGRLRTCAKYVEPEGYFAFLGSKKVGANPLPESAHPHMYETLRSGRPRIVQSHTIHDLKERVEGGPLAERPDIFYIFEPLQVNEDILGVAAINLRREDLEAITPRQRAVVQQLLSFAAIALSNARLMEQTSNLARFPAEDPNPVLRVARDGTILYANKAASTLLHEWGCRVGQQVPERWHQLVLDALRSGSRKDIEIECGKRTLSVTCAPVTEAAYVNLYGLDITERKRAEQQTQLAYAELNQVFDTAADAIVVIDKRFNVIRANETYAILTGVSRRELLGKKCYELLPGSVCHTSKCTLARILDGEERVEYEIEKTRGKGGAKIPCLLTATPFRGPDGELIGMVESVRDITERKRAEEVLRRSEERYALAQRAAGIGSWDWDILTGGLSWSDTIEPMFGFPPGQFRGTYEAFLECVHPEDRQRVVESVNACVEADVDYGIEHRIVWPDGTVRWMQETGDVVRDGSGRAVRMLGVVQDITERRRAEEAIRAHAALMEAIFESSQNPLVYLDREFNFVQVNEAYARSCARSKKEFSGRNYFDFYPSEAQAIFERVRDTGEPYTALARPFTFPDHPEWGETYWDWTLTPVKGAAGQIDGFVFSLVDITDRIRHQQEIEEANRRLQGAFNYQAAVLGSLEEVVLSLDLEGRIIYSNPAASRTFGYSPEELRRLKVCDLRIGCEEADSGCLVRQLAQTEAAIHDPEVEFRNREGYSISGRQALTPLRDPAGALIGAVLVIQDVSTVRRLESHAAYLSEEITELSGRHGLMVASQAMEQVMKQVSLVAPTDSSVLILGETGTGKELIARVIHDMSPRKDKPLVKVHCAALSPGLIESEFFGHERGAFTGALSRRIGRFELADRGTIFLDEVGDIPLETQVKLLRVIQEREFERVGGTRPIKVDVRIIAATNRNMEEAVDSGSFRRDLFYRLSVFPIRVPALRERPEAIPVLAAHFAQDCAKPLGKQIEGISPESLRRLQAYDWPGNVRELRNVIERAVITSPGPLVTVPGLGFRPEPGEPSAASDDLEENERRHILRVLEKTSWRIEGQGGAAELLRINASTLRSRLKKLGIEKPKPSRDIPQPAASSRSTRPPSGTRR